MRVTSKPRSWFSPPQLPAGNWRARSWAPQPRLRREIAGLQSRWGFTSKVPHRFEQCAERFSQCLQRETDVWGGKKRLASAAFEVLDPLPTAFSTCYYSNLWRPV